MTSLGLDLINQNFLEKALNRKINTFKVTEGTNPGDNYCSVIYSVQVDFPPESSSTRQNESEKNNNLQENVETIYLFIKSYPRAAARQALLIGMNSFMKELSFYQTYIPHLTEMQKDVKPSDKIQPAFPAFVAGHATDYDKVHVAPGNVDILDNCLILVDLRKTYGFKMANRMDGFDRNHILLVVEAMARNHALCWAYKQKHKLSKITEHFPFIVNDYSDDVSKDLWEGMASASKRVTFDTLEFALGKESTLLSRVKEYMKISTNNILDIAFGEGERNDRQYEKYFRVKPPTSDNEIPWNVVTQIDSWSNNILFRYNQETGLPEEAILVDLQLCRETCPTYDLCYLIYNGTDSEFRKHHLDDILNFYVENFRRYCLLLDVLPLPNFSLDELKRRFHRTKIYALYFVLAAGPLLLIDSSKTYNMETQGAQTVKDLFATPCNDYTCNKTFIDRLVGLCNDMYNDGVI